MTEETDKISDAINNYYKLKYDYENDFYEGYVKKIVMSKNSTKEKKRMFQKLPKPECVNCMRNVGSIFSIKLDVKGISHVYNAQCGDTMDPCPLNIQIETPTIELFSTLFSSYNLNKIKKKIILAKNDLLFGYIKQEQAFNKFDKLASILKEESSTYNYYLENAISLFDNIEVKNNLQKKQVQLGINIQEFKDMMRESKIQNNVQLINNAVEFYIQTIVPLVNEIETIKYPVNKIEIINGEYHLVQKKNKIEDTYFEYNEPKLISFVTGTKNVKKTKANAKSKTVKVTNIESVIGTEPKTKNKPKSKTKKNPVIFEVIPESLPPEITLGENTKQERKREEEERELEREEGELELEREGEEEKEEIIKM